MTRVKSLRPNGVPWDDSDDPAGYAHRIHRSKKGRSKDFVKKKKGKVMRQLLLEKFDKRHPPE